VTEEKIIPEGSWEGVIEKLSIAPPVELIEYPVMACPTVALSLLLLNVKAGARIGATYGATVTPILKYLFGVWDQFVPWFDD